MRQLYVEYYLQVQQPYLYYLNLKIYNKNLSGLSSSSLTNIEILCEFASTLDGVLSTCVTPKGCSDIDMIKLCLYVI